MKKILTIIILFISMCANSTEMTVDIKKIFEEKVLRKLTNDNQHVCVLGIVNLKTRLLDVEGRFSSDYSYVNLYNPENSELFKCKDYYKVNKNLEIRKIQTLPNKNQHICHLNHIYSRSINNSVGLFNKTKSYIYNNVYDIRTEKPLECENYKEYILYLTEIQHKL